MKFNRFLLIALFFLSFFTQDVKATHTLTGELSYRWVSGSTYEVSFVLYAYQGTNYPSWYIVKESANNSYSSTDSIYRLPITGTNVPPLNPLNYLNCTPGSPTFYHEVVYRGNITLPFQARDWIFSTGFGGSFTSSNISGPGSAANAYAGLNNKDFPDGIDKNISPIWHNRRPSVPGHTTDTIVNFPSISVCQSRKYLHDQSTREYQGDRVKYILDTGRVTFNSPFSPTYVLPHVGPQVFNLDTATGALTFNPGSPIGNYYIPLKALEYRVDTDLVGTSYVAVEKEIGFITRMLHVHITDSSSCPDLNYDFTDSNGVVKTNPYTAINLQCQENKLTFGITDNIECSSLDTNGSDFLLIDLSTQDSIPIRKAEARGCQYYHSSDLLDLYLDSFLVSGTYRLYLRKGNDGNSLRTECGRYLGSFDDSLDFQVIGPPALGEIQANLTGSLDTLVLECGQSSFDVHLSKKAVCTSVHPTDFSINKSGSVGFPGNSITGLNRNCLGVNTKKVTVHLSSGIEPGIYTVQLVVGTDGNSFTNTCNVNWDSSSIVVIVPKLLVDLPNDFAYCKRTILDTNIKAGLGYTSYLWNNGSFGAFIHIDTAGKYWVEVKNQYGCAASDTLIVSEKECYVGIENKEQTELTIYPNPTNGIVNIKLTNPVGNEKVELFNLLGKQLTSQSNADLSYSIKLEMDAFKEGIYFIKVSRESEILATKRLIYSKN